MNNMSEPLVYFIILNYCGFSNTCECVDSIKEIAYKNYKIVIVDNDSRDQSYEKLKIKYSDLTVLKTDGNIGYAGGNNLGIKFAQMNKAEYLCVMNNDVKVSKDFLKILVESMEINLDIAIAGPVICEWESDTIQSAGAFINLYTGESSCFKAGKNYYDVQTDKVFCDYVSGACLMVRTSAIKDIGYIPEVYFLFYEETEWCLCAKMKSYKICCFTKSRVWHKESATIGKMSTLKQYFLDRNRVLFIKRNTKVTFTFIPLTYILLQTCWRALVKVHPTAGLGAFKDGVLGQVRPIYQEFFRKQ